MNEYAPQYILPALALIVAGVAWYCYRWGRDDGRAEGHSDGYAAGRKDVWADVWNSSAAAKVPPKPDLSGGPREPA